MKFSTATLLTLANGIVAMPWSVSPGNSKDEVTLHIKVSHSGVKHQKVSNLFSQDICWMLCASESLECPEGWTAKQMGDCWTCCRDVGDDYGL
ncbi:hypothetical protein AK830_g7198 [Neonectria ditissima]|uniref:Uncharacterized protein n=1 Tax=Neonectria ditissima TaxID=78410 RepID=A0A0P7BEI9_9HYPO|nr:hypothetical protein AK830_g7198 [Neonectria ditissima]